MKAIQSDIYEGSTSDLQQINSTTKLQCWKNVAGDKSRGRCFGIVDLVGNIFHGVPFLIQPSLLAPSTNHLVENEKLCQQVLEANQKAKAIKERDDETNQKYALLKDKLKKKISLND